MALSAVVLTVLTLVVIFGFKKMRKMYGESKSVETDTEKENIKEKKDEEEEEKGKSNLAVGGHNHEEVGVYYNCPECKRLEGKFVEVSMEEEEERCDAGRSYKGKKKKNPRKKSFSTPFSSIQYILRKKTRRAKQEEEDEETEHELSDKSSSTSNILFDVENVGRRRHSADEWI